MKTIVQALIYSNVWVALCFCSLFYGITRHYQLDNTDLLTAFAFFATLTAYQLHRLIRLQQITVTPTSNSRLQWMINHFRFQKLLFLIAALPTLTFFYLMPWNKFSLVLVGINSIIVLLYVLPIKWMHHGIRNIPFSKNSWISLSWMLLLFLPFSNYQIPIPFHIIALLGCLVYLFIIPFDIRDLHVDSPSLKTIPQLIGATSARFLGFAGVTIGLLLLQNLMGFHWILVAIEAIVSLGFFTSAQVKNLLFLEFLWELPLFLLGVYFCQI